MSFFMRFPRVWIVIWSIFGLGSLVMAFDAISSSGVDATRLTKGLIGIAVALIMIGYITKGVRTKNA